MAVDPSRSATSPPGEVAPAWFPPPGLPSCGTRLPPYSDPRPSPESTALDEDMVAPASVQLPPENRSPDERFPLPPLIFDRADPTLEWINNHPYEDCGFLGQGAFGSVRKVKLLTPLGYTVQRDAQGVPIFKDVEGDMVLRKMTDEEWSNHVGGVDCTRVLQESVSGGRTASAPGAWTQQLNLSGISCASKQIIAKSPEELQCCLQEIQLMKSVGDCEHIVRIYDHSTIWTSYICKVIIVMELGDMDFGHYLKSRSLWSGDENDQGAQKPEAEKKRPMDAVEIFAWWRQMVAGIQAVHSQEIMHCDLKPSNFILVRRSSPREDRGALPREHEEYTLKLCDFGVSRQLKNSETHHTIVNAFGTVLYMSPEMLHNSQHCMLHITKAVDIWGLGVILHQMLHNGSTPYGHLLEYGRWRLMVAIPDEKAARMKTKCPRLLDEGDPPPQTPSHDSTTTSTPPSESEDFLRMPTQQRRHDLLLGFQLSCLARAVDQRPTIAHLCFLLDTAEPFFEPGSSCSTRDEILPRDEKLLPRDEIDVNISSSSCGDDEKTQNANSNISGAGTSDYDNATSTRGPSCIGSDEGLMALKILIGRVVVANVPMRMMMSSAGATSDHGYRKIPSMDQGDSLLAQQDGSSVDHGTTSHSASLRRPLVSQCAQDIGKGKASTWCGSGDMNIKVFLGTIGLLLLVVTGWLVGRWSVSRSSVPIVPSSSAWTEGQVASWVAAAAAAGQEPISSSSRVLEVYCDPVRVPFETFKHWQSNRKQRRELRSLWREELLQRDIVDDATWDVKYEELEPPEDRERDLQQGGAYRYLTVRTDKPAPHEPIHTELWQESQQIRQNSIVTTHQVTTRLGGQFSNTEVLADADYSEKIQFDWNFRGEKPGLTYLTLRWMEIKPLKPTTEESLIEVTKIRHTAFHRWCRLHFGAALMLQERYRVVAEDGILSTGSLTSDKHKTTAMLSGRSGTRLGFLKFIRKRDRY